jgi:hypothetical protein
MVEADAVAVVCARRLCLPKTDVHTSRSAEVDDALATLANDLACPRVPEWPEQPAVEREASVEVATVLLARSDAWVVPELTDLLRTAAGGRELRRPLLGCLPRGHLDRGAPSLDVLRLGRWR